MKETGNVSQSRQVHIDQSLFKGSIHRVSLVLPKSFSFQGGSGFFMHRIPLVSLVTLATFDCLESMCLISVFIMQRMFTVRCPAELGLEVTYDRGDCQLQCVQLLHDKALQLVHIALYLLVANVRHERSQRFGRVDGFPRCCQERCCRYDLRSVAIVSEASETKPSKHNYAYLDVILQFRYF